MSDAVDTSAEAVERLAADLCARWDDVWELLRARETAAATLRALLAERDALKAKADDALHRRDEKARGLADVAAERDAALAEVARLREALDFYADTFCELGAADECCGKLDTEHCSGCIARAALAKETGHD